MAIFTWRAVQKKLPTDDRVARFGYNLVTTCHCFSSSSSELESVEHLFSSSNFAAAIWNKLAGICGVSTRGLQFKHILLQWWGHKTLDIVSSFMVKILPALITWELWRTRNEARYGSEIPSVHRSKYLVAQVFFDLVGQKFGKLQVQRTWEQLQLLEDLQMIYKSCKLVKWLKPPPLLHKLNTDGSCQKGNFGDGGIIRDSKGKLITAFSIYLGPGTSNWEESQAMLFGLQFARQMASTSLWRHIQDCSLPVLIGKRTHRGECWKQWKVSVR